MSVYQHSPSSRLTPRKGQSLAKPPLAAREDSNVQLTLQTVIGSTVSSPNDFAIAPSARLFAYCAGSAVVLAAVDATFNIQKHFFRAKPDALPLHVSPSYYSTVTSTKASESRAHTASPTKDESVVNSPNRSRINQRPKSTSCVSLSPSGKYLAVGEIGHHPRVLFFSTAHAASSELLLGCLTDHTFGVRALAFSQNSRWLCSLGDLHDGGFLLWSINPKSGALKLYASNRCTTADSVAWMGSNAIISVGTRHVKVWRLQESTHSKQPLDLDSIWDGSFPNPSPRILTGRNCLLGPLMDAVFSCVTPISDEKAILCTQDGAICLLDDTDRSQRLTQVAQVDFIVHCITVDHYSGVVWLGPHDGEPEALSLDIFTGFINQTAIDSATAIENMARQSLASEANRRQRSANLAIGMIGSRLIQVDASHTISIFEVTSGAGKVELGTTINHLPAHDNAALGAIALSRPNEQDSDFLTYSVNGDVFYWLWDGTFQNRFKITLNRLSVPSGDPPNEIRILNVIQDCNALVAGDKDGVLRLFSLTGDPGGVEKAHDGDINDLALCQMHCDTVIIASCGRDKTIQIVRWSKREVNIEQTLINEHVGSINKVVFANNGAYLISMSSDRTLIVRQKVLRADNSFAFISTRVITLKTAPIAMSVYPNDTEKLIVSTIDRWVRTIDVTSGHTVSTFKVADSVNSDAVVLLCVSIGSRSLMGRNKALVAGASSTDRSLRIYDCETGTLLARDHGPATVSSLILAQRETGDGIMRYMLVSTGSDGTVMIWTLTGSQDIPSNGHATHFGDSNDSKSQSISTLRPLRRVLSKTEIRELHQDAENRDPTTPTGKRTTPRARKKTSAYNLSTNAHYPSASTAGRKNLQPQSPPQSPSVTLQSKMMPPLLDERPRAHHVGNPASLKLTAERVCACLRALRQQISSSGDILKPDTAEALQRELQMTLDAIGHPSPLSRLEVEASDGEQFGDYLSRLIDERLALRLQPEDGLDATEGSRLSKVTTVGSIVPGGNIVPPPVDMGNSESTDVNL